MNSIILIVILQLIGSATIIAEIMIPSMGILSVSAAAAYAYSYYSLYQIAPEAIWILVIINIFSIPATLIIGVKMLSNSPLAKQKSLHTGIFLNTPTASVGDRGVSVTDLRPAGIAKIDGERKDVLSTGDYIEKGIEIEVVEVDNSGVKVKVLN